MKTQILHLAIFVLLLASCTNNSLNENSSTKGSDEYVEPNQDDLDFSDTGNSIFPEVSSGVQAKAVNTNVEKVEGNSTTLPLEKIFSLSPMTVGNEPVQATDVVYSNGYILVSYACEGTAYAGGIQIIKLDQAADYSSLTPETIGNYISITDQWVNTNADVNMIAVNGSKVYAIGSVSTSGSFESLESPAILFEFNIEGGKFKQENNRISYNYYALSSYAGKDVDYNNGKLFTVTGDAGDLAVFNATSMEQQALQSIADARSVKVHNNVTYVLSGNGVDKYDLNAKYISSLVEFAGNIIGDGGDYAGAQRILSVTDDYVIAPLGVYGVSAYNPNSGTPLFHLQPASSYNDNSNYEIAVNSAIAVNYAEKKYLLVATGEAGLAEAVLSNDPYYECVYDLDGKSGVAESANMVTSFSMGANLLVAVATGNDGLHLLRVADDAGNGGNIPTGCNPVLCEDENIQFEDYDSKFDYSDMGGEQKNIKSTTQVSIRNIGNGTLVWSGPLNVKNVDSDARLDICGDLQFDGNAKIDGVISGNMTIEAQNYNSSLTVEGSILWVRNFNAQVKVSCSFTLQDGNMNGNGSVEAGGDVVMASRVNGPITAGGNVTVDGQNNGTITAGGNIQVNGDANGTIVCTSNTTSVTIAGNFQGSYIYCPSGKVTIQGSNNSKIYVDAGNAGNVIILGNKNGQVIEGKPSL